MVVASANNVDFMIKGVTKFQAFGQELWVTTTEIGLSIVTIVILIIAVIANRKMKRATEVPGTFQNIVEFVVEALDNMNMWGLSPAFLEELERGFPGFLAGLKEGDVKTEYLLPKIIDKLVGAQKAQVTVLETRDRWFGVTYKEDKPAVAAAIRNLVSEGVYPERLFDVR